MEGPCSAGGVSEMGPCETRWNWNETETRNYDVNCCYFYCDCTVSDRISPWSTAFLPGMR